MWQLRPILRQYVTWLSNELVYKNARSVYIRYLSTNYCNESRIGTMPHFMRNLKVHNNFVMVSRNLTKQTTSSARAIAAFKQIDGKVDRNDRTYQVNREKNEVLVAKYLEMMKIATGGGSEKAVERHTKKNKKLLVEDRLAQLFDDEGKDILELSPLAGLGMTYGDIPRAGSIVAIGRISGVYCLVVANDATIKAGTVYPITLKKQLRAAEIAQQNRLPCVFLVDSGGAYLPLQADIFLSGGRTFYNEAIFNSLDIPQLAIVCGSCTAGAAYIPTMCQEAVIVDRIGTIFLAGPPLVKAALGELVSPEELGGAKMHSSVSGCTDYYAMTEDEAFEISRASVSAFNIQPVYNDATCEEPLYSADELLGLIHADNSPIDMHKVLARIVDGSRFHEFKASYAPTIVTGFCRIHGHLVGIIGNKGPLTGDAALKASHFVQLCVQRNVPLIFLQHITDSDRQIGTAVEEGIRISHHSALMSSLATCHVPFITIVIGNSQGVESYMMGGRSFGPRFLFCWPNAKICIDDPEKVIQSYSQTLEASLGSSGKDKAEEAVKRLSEDLQEKSTALYSSTHAWDDGVILPQDTRKVLGQCLDILSQNKSQSSVSLPAVIRM